MAELQGKSGLAGPHGRIETIHRFERPSSSTPARIAPSRWSKLLHHRQDAAASSCQRRRGSDHIRGRSWPEAHRRNRWNSFPSSLRGVGRARTHPLALTTSGQSAPPTTTFCLSKGLRPGPGKAGGGWGNTAAKARDRSPRLPPRSWSAASIRVSCCQRIDARPIQSPWHRATGHGLGQSEGVDHNSVKTEAWPEQGATGPLRARCHTQLVERPGRRDR